MTPGAGDKEMPVDEVGPGEIVGWSTLTGPYIYTATTVTAEKSTLIVISGSKLREIFEVNNHIGYRVLKGIGYVVARRMAAIEAKCAVGRRAEVRADASFSFEERVAAHVERLEAGDLRAVEKRVAQKRLDWLENTPPRTTPRMAAADRPRIASPGVRAALLRLHGACPGRPAGGGGIRLPHHLALAEPLPDPGGLLPARSRYPHRLPRRSTRSPRRSSSPNSIPGCGSCATTRPSARTPRTAARASSGSTSRG